MMNVNVQGLRRNVKNVVRNYTDAQVKVREATSNDPWGAPSTLMGEIADLTYNVVAFTEIMQIVWKRLNDNGKNWRHVYKALVLLEYLIKVGSERVASQCKENIFNIQTLKDFQYVEDNKDQGMNVREKSKQLVSLLKDDERLRQERMRALKAKERFAQNTNVAAAESGGTSRRAYSGGEELASPRDYRAVLGSNSELESARPQTAGEEELQLQLALAMSKEEAEQEERQRKNDDLRLQMALTESQQEAVKPRSSTSVTTSNGASSKSCMDDLLGLNLGGAGQAVGGATGADPWGLPPSQPAAAAAAAAAVAAFPGVSVDAMPASLVGAVGGLDPWAPAPSVQADPWAPQPATSLPSAAPDPWALNGAAGGVSKGELDEFDLISRQRLNNMSPAMGGDKLGGSANNSPAPFDMSGLGGALPKTTGHNNGSISNMDSNSKMRKTPESFLGANSNLVNLDALVTAKPVSGTINPFGGNVVPATGPAAVSSAISASAAVPTGIPAAGGGGGGSLIGSSMTPPQQNPFQALNKPPTMNELRGGNAAGFDGSFASGPTRTTPTPGSVNPFL